MEVVILILLLFLINFSETEEIHILISTINFINFLKYVLFIFLFYPFRMYFILSHLLFSQGFIWKNINLCSFRIKSGQEHKISF